MQNSQSLPISISGSVQKPESAHAGAPAQNPGASESMISETSEAKMRDLTVPSVEPSQILGPEESQSMSLIDKSTNVLLGLMNSVERDSGQSKVLNPSLINGAANCAAQIQKLLRLKMEIVKGKSKSHGK